MPPSSNEPQRLRARDTAPRLQRLSPARVGELTVTGGSEETHRAGCRHPVRTAPASPCSAGRPVTCAFPAWLPRMSQRTAREGALCFIHLLGASSGRSGSARNPPSHFRRRGGTHPGQNSIAAAFPQTALGDTVYTSAHFPGTRAPVSGSSDFTQGAAVTINHVRRPLPRKTPESLCTHPPPHPSSRRAPIHSLTL